MENSNNLRHILYNAVFFSIITLVSCSHNNNNTYSIKGIISGKTPVKIYMGIYQNGKMDTIDSSGFINGKFRFTGKVSEPDFYYIFTENNKNSIGFFLENSKIVIKAHIDSLSNAHISGSKVQDTYINYKKNAYIFESQLEDIYKAYKSAQEENTKLALETKYDSIDSLRIEYIKDFIENNNNSVIAPFLIKKELVYSMDLNELETITNKLSPELKDNKYVQKLYKRIVLLRKLQPGMPAPDFTQTTPEGDTISISDYRGKYLLIDFWASWCTPCRYANPEVLRIYKRYHWQGFDILGVSMDKNREAWIKAIESDGLLWKQVSTLSGWNNPAGKLYGVNSIPHAILIDKDGKIIERGITPNKLEKLLHNIFKK